MSEEATIQAILATCHDRGIGLSAAGEKLSVDAPEGAITPDLLDGLRHHKACLLRMLRSVESRPEAPPSFIGPHEAAIFSIPADGDAVSGEECIEPPDPCPKCGSLMFWWDLLGGQHCMACEKPKYPPEKVAELRELAKRLRQSSAMANPLPGWR
jgi:hypothetical protein